MICDTLQFNNGKGTIPRSKALYFHFTSVIVIYYWLLINITKNLFRIQILLHEIDYAFSVLPQVINLFLVLFTIIITESADKHCTTFPNYSNNAEFYCVQGCYCKPCAKRCCRLKSFNPTQDKLIRTFVCPLHVESSKCTHYLS